MAPEEIEQRVAVDAAYRLSAAEDGHGKGMVTEKRLAEQLLDVLIGGVFHHVVPMHGEPSGLLFVDGTVKEHVVSAWRWDLVNPPTEITIEVKLPADAATARDPP